MTKATTNLVKTREDVPQKLRFFPNAGFAIRSNPPILCGGPGNAPYWDIMAGVRSLDLPTSPRAAVFRAMETIVRANSIFQRIVKPGNFRTWQGDPNDIKPFTLQEAPCMRWTPMNTGEEFKTPDTMIGDLLINCEVLIKGTNCSDLTNFW